MFLNCRTSASNSFILKSLRSSYRSILKPCPIFFLDVGPLREHSGQDSRSQRLKDTEWLSRQDPYVIVKYGGKVYRTATCTDGGRNPKFCDTFRFKLFEGLREVEISVYNSNTLSSDDFIGSGKVYLEEVLWRGYQDSSCTLINNQRSAGEIKLILKYPNAQNSEAILPQLPAFIFQAPPPSPKRFYQTPPPQYQHYPAYQPQYPPQPQQPPAYDPYAPYPPVPYYPPHSPYNGRYPPY